MHQTSFDYWVVYFAVKGPVALGVAILFASGVPASRLARELPSRCMRLRWWFLTVLIALLSLGYSLFLAIDWHVGGSVQDLLVPAMLFLIAAFIHVVNSFSLETAHDLRRIALLEHESSVDGLMGIYNRRYLDRALAVEVSRAHRFDVPLSILILDLDHFKQINDTYGHQVGDRVLKRLGQLLQQSCRRDDILSRYGGEEIVLIARNTLVQEAAELGERLRRLVESELLVPIDETDGGRELRVTASIGVSGLDAAVRDAESLLAAADRALYEAKRGGRNRVARGAAQLVEAGPRPVARGLSWTAS